MNLLEIFNLVLEGLKLPFILFYYQPLLSIMMFGGMFLCWLFLYLLNFTNSITPFHYLLGINNRKNLKSSGREQIETNECSSGRYH